MATQIYQ